ncbi:MAG: PQQ-dependent sugar dehydrogenase [Methanoregulaceae archaeon]|nr:PQQ-dependent sugar dehydrogenase [Methanoregulaceae archaeon]
MRKCILAALLVTSWAVLSPAQEGFATTNAITGLNAPTCMAFAPDGRVFVGEKGGSIKVYQNGSLISTFTTISCSTNSERGVLGLALDPNFAANRFVYVYYTTNNLSLSAPPTPKNRVSRFTELANVAVPGSETILLDNIPSDAGNHNAGCIRFGLDGKLYIATGDGGSTPALSQNLTSIAGKILRINSNGTIPSDNPFVGTGNRGEIWAYGLRNPFRFQFRPGTLVPYIADVGQSSWEEINVGVPGGNYGWNLHEGPSGGAGFIHPIHAYSHNGGSRSVTGGGFVGNRWPVEFQSRYVFGDYVLNQLFWVQITAGNGYVSNGSFLGVSSPVDFALGPDGAMYVVSLNTGTIKRIAYEPTVASVSGPQALVGGNAGQGTVTLEFPASAGGQVVTLVCSNPSALQVPASVNIPAGQYSVAMPITTSGVNTNTTVTVTASAYGQAKSVNIGVLRAGIGNILASPNPVVGGNTATGTIILDGKAGPSGSNVSLFSGNPNVAQVPANLQIPAGSTSGTFPITTTAVSSVTHLSINSTLGASSKAVSLRVDPLPMLVNSLVINPNRIKSGSGTTGTVTISRPAPEGGQAVKLAVNASIVYLPATMTIPAASTVGTFPITTGTIDYTVTLNVVASIGTSKRVATLTLDPCPIRALAVYPNSIPGGLSVNGQVVLRNAASGGGATVVLSDNSPATAPQASVSILAGQTTGNFTVLTAVVSTNVLSTLYAMYDGATRTTQLTVTNVVALHSVNVTPTQLKGGASATGRVVLTKLAQSVMAVALSDNLSVLTTPSTVSVPVGSNQANFPVTTLPVANSYTGTIIAQLNGIKRTCTLRIDP